jgi:hypothetical protein
MPAPWHELQSVGGIAIHRSLGIDQGKITAATFLFGGHTIASQSWYVRPRVAAFSYDICGQIQAALLGGGNSGYEGCCDGKNIILFA